MIGFSRVTFQSVIKKKKYVRKLSQLLSDTPVLKNYVGEVYFVVQDVFGNR